MNYHDHLSHRGPLSPSLGPPVIPQENLHQMMPSTSSRYLFPSPRPSGIPQENPHYMMNPPISYGHLLPSSGPAGIPPSTSYGQSMNNYFIAQSVNRHYLPQYPLASTQDVNVHGCMPPTSGFASAAQGGGLWDGKDKGLTLGTPPSCANLVNQVSDGKSESKRQRKDQDCEKKMSGEQLKNNGTMEFVGSCFRCGEKYHKAEDCPQKKKKMSDEQLKNNGTIEGSCFTCGEKDHKAGDCPRKKMKMSGKQLKNNGTIEFGGSCYRCGEKYHKAGDCPNKKKMLDELHKNNGAIESSCFACGEKDHKAGDCPQKKKKMTDEQPKDDGTFRGSCYLCRGKYHKAEDCPQKKQMSDEQLKNDGKKNHKAKNCPHQKKKMSGEQLKNDDTIEGSCFHCGEKDHKAKNCPHHHQKKMSGEQLKKNDNHSQDLQGHYQQDNPNSDHQKALSLPGPNCQQGQPQQFTLPTHGKSSIGAIIQQLWSMRFDGEGSVCEYILQMENLVCQLRELKMEVGDDFLVHMVLNSLPEAFNTVKLEYYSTIDTWSVNELIAHCVHVEAEA